MAWEDNVRPYQLPDSAFAMLALSQYNLSTNEPIILKPGFGGTSSGQLPPVQIVGGSWSQTVTAYMDAAAVEALHHG
jgi:hypothetical protein